MYVCTYRIHITYYSFFPIFFFIPIPFLLEDDASCGTTQGVSRNRKQGVIRESFINSWWICKKKGKGERRSEARISLVSSDFFLFPRGLRVAI